MRWPWSLIAGLVLLAVGVVLLVVGAVAAGAEELIDPGTYTLTSGISLLAGQGIDAVQDRISSPP